MSSRRKGKPQQRKHVESVEDDHDLLTCGKCQKEFHLYDINKFIQHKVSRCNKENVQPTCNVHTNDDADDSDSPDDDTSTSLPRTKNGSPVKIRELGEEISQNSGGKNLREIFDNKDSLEKIIRDELSKSQGQTSPVKQAIQKDENPSLKSYTDAETNTVYSEPSLLTCSTCKSVYSSSWFLIQHVQKQHRLSIYVADSPSSPLKSPTEHAPESPFTKNSNTTKPLEASLKNPPSTKNEHSPSLGNQVRISSQTSPLISQHLFSPSTPPFISPHPRPSTTPTLSWHPFPRPQLSTDLISLPPDYVTDQLRRFATSLPFRPNSALDGTYPDVYSSRLRQLAANPAVTDAPSSPTSSSPAASAKKISLPSPDAPSAFSAPSSSTSKVSSVSPPGGATERTLSPAGALGPAPDGPPANNGRKCEICDKFFKYGSNLIVHKRAHTGEKPYKCPHCPRTCMQACTLRKHLVLRHKTSSQLLLPVPQQTLQDEDANSEDEEVDDSETFALREAQCQAEIIMYTKEHLKLASNELRPKVSSEGHGAATPTLESALPHAVPCTIPGTGILMKNDALSVMVDFMQKTGMDQIEQYNEAFQEAIKESRRKESEDGDEKESNKQETPASKERPASSDDLDESCDAGESRDSSPPIRRQSTPSRDRSPDEATPSKKVKLEGSSSQPTTPSALFTSPLNYYPREITASIYPNIWFPPAVTLPNPCDYFPITPPSTAPFSAPALAPRSQDITVGNQPSALKFIPGPTARTPVSTIVITPITSTTQSTTQSNTSPGSAPNQQLKRRNDTCEFCGKIFKNCSNLTVHRRSHTGEKPYKCNLCSYACAQSSKLTRHMRTHCRLGKDVYRCKFCDMPFSVPSTLEKHMRKCMEMKPGVNATTSSSSSMMKSSKSSANRIPASLQDFNLFKSVESSTTSTGVSDPFPSVLGSGGGSLPGNLNGPADRSDSSSANLYPGIDLRKLTSSNSTGDDDNVTKGVTETTKTSVNGSSSDSSANVFLSGIDLSTSRPSNGSLSSSPKPMEAVSSPADLASLRFNNGDTQRSPDDSMDASLNITDSAADHVTTTPTSQNGSDSPATRFYLGSADDPKIEDRIDGTATKRGQGSASPLAVSNGPGSPAHRFFAGVDLSKTSDKPDKDEVDDRNNVVPTKSPKAADCKASSRNGPGTHVQLRFCTGVDLTTAKPSEDDAPGSDDRIDALSSKCALSNSSPTNNLTLGTV